LTKNRIKKKEITKLGRWKKKRKKKALDKFPLIFNKHVQQQQAEKNK